MERPENEHFPYGVYCRRFASDPCRNGYAIEITRFEYVESKKKGKFECPICGGLAEFDRDSKGDTNVS